MPKYFKTLCHILNTRPCYEAIVKSLVNCYSVYKNEDKIKKYIDIQKVLSNFKELSAKIINATTFIKILKEDLDFINKFVQYLELKDCPSHSELHHHIQKSQDEILSISSIEILPGLKRYQDNLKEKYIKMEANDLKVEADDKFNTNIDINQFVNLSLIKPQDETKDKEYFDALNEPQELLFNHKECTNTNTTPLKSLAEIFDISGSVTQKILLHGSPGSGKTTLAHKICIDWAKGNLIKHYTLVILLNLRNVKIRNIESIEEMVEHTITMGDEFVSEVVRDITCIEGKNILLLLEGWDELPEDKQSFFAKTIAGKLLKKVSVLITSRPSSIGNIERGYITRNISILGFSEDQIEQYVDQSFPTSSHGPKNILKYRFMDQLKTNPVLKSLAYVPVNLKILVYVFKKYESKLPDTLTELYQQYVLLKLRLYNQRKTGRYHEFTFTEIPKYISEKLEKICKLAYDGIETQKLSIDDDTVTIKELDKDGMGLLQVSHYMLLEGSEKTYDFIHKTVQEFLAAKHLKTFPGKEQKDIFLGNKLNKDFVKVLFFYAGLTGLKLFNPKELFPTVFVDEKSTYFKVVDAVLPFLNDVMIKNDELRFAAKIDMARDYAKCNNNNELCVLISCIAEAKNPEVCRAFSSSDVFHKDLCFINIPNSAITSQLLVSLSYCIAHSGRSWAVKCKNKIFGESDILSLQKHLTDTDSPGKLWHLDTKSNRNEIIYLTTFLQPQFALYELDLHGSQDFDDDCVSILCSALTSNQTLASLGLGICKISPKRIRIIAEMLQVNNALRLIDLQCNCLISDDDLIQALVIMKNNTTLLMMMVDDDLFEDEKVIKQLQMFNKKRKKPLVLNKYHAFRFSGLLSKLDVLNWSRS